MNEQNLVLDWDGVLENKGSEFPVPPESDYALEVTGFERGSFSGSEKMRVGNKATLTLKIESEQGIANIFDDLILYKRMDMEAFSVLLAIGHKKTGECVTMNWNAVIWARGRAHFVINRYTDCNGQERENNKVGKYLEYDESFMPKSAGVDENGFMQIPEMRATEYYSLSTGKNY